MTTNLSDLAKTQARAAIRGFETIRPEPDHSHHHVVKYTEMANLTKQGQIEADAIVRAMAGLGNPLTLNNIELTHVSPKAGVLEAAKALLHGLKPNAPAQNAAVSYANRPSNGR